MRQNSKTVQDAIKIMQARTYKKINESMKNNTSRGRNTRKINEFADFLTYEELLKWYLDVDKITYDVLVDAADDGMFDACIDAVGSEESSNIASYLMEKLPVGFTEYEWSEENGDFLGMFVDEDGDEFTLSFSEDGIDNWPFIDYTDPYEYLGESIKTPKTKIAITTKRRKMKKINESANSDMLLDYMNNYVRYYITDGYGGDGPVIDGLTASESSQSYSDSEVKWYIQDNMLICDFVDYALESHTSVNLDYDTIQLYFPFIAGYENVSLQGIQGVKVNLYNGETKELLGELPIQVYDASDDTDMDSEYYADNNDFFANQFKKLLGIRESEQDEGVRKLQESVASRFARYRRMFEGEEDDNNDDSTTEKDPFDFSEDDETSDSDKDRADNNDDSEEEENEDVPMTAVILTVNKDDAEKCKDEMVDAGIDEDDIEILDSDDDDETAEIKVDANSVMELKDYLKGKGIDLEEKIGGEIVDDNEDEESTDDKDKEDSEEDKKSKDDDNLGDFTEDDLDDLFADDADTEETK